MGLGSCLIYNHMQKLTILTLPLSLFVISNAIMHLSVGSPIEVWWVSVSGLIGFAGGMTFILASVILLLTWND